MAWSAAVRAPAALMVARGRWWLVVLALAASWPAGVARAAETHGLAVSPAYQQVTLAEGQAAVQLTLEFSNFSGADQSLHLSTTDFGSLNEEGGVAFLGDSADRLGSRYGLASWMVLEKDALFLPAGGSASVEVTIENRESLAPGGHYGAVLATVVNDAAAGGRQQVGVKQVLSSLVLVSKEGGAAPELALVSQTGDGEAWRLPGQVEHRFQNAGNVHVTPRGVVELRDPAGRVVRRGALNAESGTILPESFRRYETPMQTLALAWLPGRYTLSTTYRYDGTAATKTLTTHVWYAGLLVVWVVALLALTAAGVLAWGLWWRPRRRRGAAGRERVRGR